MCFGLFGVSEHLCTFNETLFFVGSHAVELAQTSGPSKCFDVMHSGYAFPTKHEHIRGGVKGIMYYILVVSQYVFQHCDAIIEWMIVVWMIVVWMNAEWIRIHRGGQTAMVGRMGGMGIINSW